MKKKFLIGAIALIVFIIFVFIFYWFYNAQNIRSKVLSQLEQNFEFCSILSDNINGFSGSGEFWMICNGRPFYAEYKNGNVSYELNGWGLLKRDSEVWDDLKNCDFYDSRNSELIFYCPRDFNSEKLIAKTFQFDVNLLKMRKVREEDFLKILHNDIKQIYPFLSFCKIKNFTSLQPGGNYPSVLFIRFNCEGKEYQVGTDFLTIPLQPPILMDSSLSYKERARISFENSFNCTVKNITEGNSVVFVRSLCKGSDVTISYDFKNTPFLSYKIECSEDNLENCLKEWCKFFIIVPFDTKLQFEKKIGNSYIYKAGEKLMFLTKVDNLVEGCGVRREWMH
jgi:hypothetical protein